MISQCPRVLSEPDHVRWELEVGPTIDLVPGFNERNGHHYAGELQVWMRHLTQRLRLAHL